MSLLPSPSPVHPSRLTDRAVFPSGAFVHARLADNVEISNPMYLAGDDDADAPPPAPLAQRHSVSVSPSLLAK